ncbi:MULTISPECIES: CRISPR-associated protein Cas5 [unclassified Crossiella]|uniref:CRISPR-associated protein Cas5 n=1 Tax=unclassified Crossiella TaxID=2620835 RepID=UPI00200010C7|nr:MULTISPECIES: CRISPR-associated protein Cas5 [unclassified Crossiella]MCK2245196.1 CRISPR-associated protein Cas5 [Crossiella sp. S99.2]MCK2258882.1 CRISPR-associated protein Cas5 [Crossiella sp. S99.1]
MTETIPALEVTVTATVTSFRDPMYAAVQKGLPCPPPATVGGMLAAAAGGWNHVPVTTRFALSFTARAEGTDLETYHPADALGRSTDPTPKDREFLYDTTLTVWLLDELDHWHASLRRPIWPLRLGRSQDLAAARPRRTSLTRGEGVQGHAVLPQTPQSRGTLLRLATATSLDRQHTRWDNYHYAPKGTAAPITDTLVTSDGQAVQLLPPVHPDTVKAR